MNRGVTMQEITINFGLIASEKFPDVARARVLTPSKVGLGYDCAATDDIADAICNHLERIGCIIDEAVVFILSNDVEPTLVVKMLYPVSDEKADCAPPSVLQYSKYMRLYEVACEYAQDCVAVLEEDGTGVLVGANCSDWGVFDRTKFITILGE